MARKRQTASARCSHPGCKEWSYFEYDSRQDARAGERTRASWKCVRHRKPDELLSLTNTRREVVLTVKPGEGRISDHHFWATSARLNSGLQYGPGFRALAGDFPLGTRLRITAEILPPEESE